MAERYPLWLDLDGRPCLVVGGGAVAARKVRGLRAAGAAVTVVAPEVTAEIADAAAAGALTWHRRGFRPGDAAGQVLVFAATDDAGANRAAAADGRQAGAWVNRADAPEACDFHVPACARRGPVTVAVATGGASPALAGWLRDRLAAAVPPAAEDLARLAEALRRGVGGDVEAYRALFDTGVGDDLARGDWGAVESKVIEAFGSGDAVREALRDLRAEER